MLAYLRDKHDVAAIDAELRQIASAMEHRRHDKDVSWSDLWTHKKVMVTGTFLVFFQAYVLPFMSSRGLEIPVRSHDSVCTFLYMCRMTGINTVMLYSAKIFHFAGISNPFLATAVVGFTNVGVTIVSISFVDTYGRRPLLNIGTVTMILALLVLSVSLLCLNSNVHVQGIIAVSAVLLFVAGFAIGLGAVVWYESKMLVILQPGSGITSLSLVCVCP